jgi:drug/metabolite transporter (DMT)-like permease
VSRRGWALFAALSVIWGVPYLLIKVAVEQLSPSLLVCLRTALAALVLVPVAVRGRMLGPVLARWPWVLAFALAEIIVPFGLLGWAELRLPSSLTGLLVAGVPLIGAVLGVLLRRPDRIRPNSVTDRRRLLGLVAGFCGVAALLGIDLRGGDLLAAAAVIVAAAGYAVGPIVVAARLAELPGLGVTVVAMGATAIVYLPWAIATRPLGPVGWRAWGSTALLGVVCSALAFLLFFALVAEVGPARMTVITYLNPVVAVLLGVAVLSERVSAGMAVGFPLVLLGSWLATRRSGQPAPA